MVVSEYAALRVEKQHGVLQTVLQMNKSSPIDLLHTAPGSISSAHKMIHRACFEYVSFSATPDQLCLPSLAPGFNL